MINFIVIINDIENHNDIKSDFIFKCLKNKEDELKSPLPGGIYLARSIIHRFFEKKSLKLPLKES